MHLDVNLPRASFLPKFGKTLAFEALDHYAQCQLIAYECQLLVYNAPSIAASSQTAFSLLDETKTTQPDADPTTNRPSLRRQIDGSCRNHAERRPVEFIDENGGGPGVRLRKRHQKKS